MKLIIELTNGKQDACGDCERVVEMLAGESIQTLQAFYNRRMPIYYFEEAC